jgi:hypothetical protein
MRNTSEADFNTSPDEEAIQRTVTAPSPSFEYPPASRAMNESEYLAASWEAKIIEDNGGPGVSRTRDLRFRKPLLYPSELRGHLWQLVKPASVYRTEIGRRSGEWWSLFLNFRRALCLKLTRLRPPPDERL